VLQTCMKTPSLSVCLSVCLYVSMSLSVGALALCVCSTERCLSLTFASYATHFHLLDCATLSASENFVTKLIETHAALYAGLDVPQGPRSAVGLSITLSAKLMWM